MAMVLDAAPVAQRAAHFNMQRAPRQPRNDLDQRLHSKIGSDRVFFEKHGIDLFVDTAHGPGGQLLVVLAESYVGKDYAQEVEGRLRYFSFRTIGDSYIGSARGIDRGSLIGNILALGDLVRVAWLPYSVVPRKRRQRVTDLLSKGVRRSPDGGRKFFGDEYVEWHTSPSRVTLLWSTDFALHQLIDKAIAVLGQPERDSYGSIDVDGEPTDAHDAMSALEAARKDEPRVTFFRMDYGDIAVTWARRSGIERVRDATVFSEAAVMFDRHDTDLATEMVANTGSDVVSRAASELVKLVADANA